MSLNQSRAEKSEGQLRKPGRSGNSGHQRGLYSSGGKGGGGGSGAAPPTPSPSSSSSASSHHSSHPPLSANRSFKKSNNGQGGHSRGNPGSLSSEAGVVAPAAAARAVQNGGHTQLPSHGSADVPPPTGMKPFDSSISKNSRPLPRPPSYQTSPGTLDSTAPTTPAKGDTSKAFTLQFGSISPGFVNGMQIPARTSSAPPNLDEQKRDQAHHESFRAIPTLPISSAPKLQHQQLRKDVYNNNQSNTGESHPTGQAKRNVPVQITAAPTVISQKPPVLPVTGMPISMTFQQPQVPMQFGGPSTQLQSQGMSGSSLQIPMSLPVGNTQQIQQQMFMPGLQSHPLPQVMMHQGQGLGFPPQMAHQLTPQLGNLLGMGMPPQYAQLQTGQFVGPRKPSVKITHPDTHEELKLDKRTGSYLDSGSSGQRPHSNVAPQSQPIPTYATGHQMSFYRPPQPNSYNPGAFFLQNPTSLPLTSTQMTSGTHAPRYNYPMSQSGSASAAVQVTVKPVVGSFAEKTGMPPPKVSMPSSKEEAPKLLKQPGEGTTFHLRQGDHQSTSGSSVQLPESVSGPSLTAALLSPESHSTTISSICLMQGTQSSVSPSIPVAPVAFHQRQGDHEITSGSSVQLPESVSGPSFTAALLSPESHSTTISSICSMQGTQSSVSPSIPVAPVAFHQRQGDHESTSGSSVQLPESVSGPSLTAALLSPESHSTTISSICSMQGTQSSVSPSIPMAAVAGSVSTVSSMDDGRREPLERSDSLKDHQKKTSKKDLCHSQQQHQEDASDAAAGSNLLSLSKDFFLSDLNAGQVSMNSEDIQAHSEANRTPTPISNLPSPSGKHDISSEILASETEQGRSISDLFDSSLVTLEKKDSQDISSGICSASETAGSSEASVSGVEADGTVSENLDAAACPNQDDYNPSGIETKPETVGVEDHGKIKASDDSSHDSDNAKVHPVFTVSDSSESLQQRERTLSEDAADDNLRNLMVSELADNEIEQTITDEEAAGQSSEAKRRVEESVPDASKSVKYIYAEETIPLSLLSLEDHHEDITWHETKSESMQTQDVDVKDSVTFSLETEIPLASVSSQMTQKPEEKVIEIRSGATSSVGLKDRPSVEVTRAKSTAVKKKKKKDILSKADAAGTNSDLYMAYKGPEEKCETAVTSVSDDSSSAVDVKLVPTDDTEEDVPPSEGDGQSKTELDDWEDAADLSTPKLRTSDNGQPSDGNKKLDDEYGNGVMSKKRYTRDFLLTFKEQCTDLPIGFEIRSDIAGALMITQLGTSHRESFPSPGRIIDRPSGAIRDRRVIGIADDDKWTKVPGPGHDIRMEVGHGATVVSFRPGQGVNHGVLRNPRGQSSSYVGGILSGPMQSMASPGGIQRGSADADRWQRGTGIQRGLIPSPQSPMQVMHKAEKKYEVGKVSDEEEAKQRQLKGILNKLTPQNFERLFEKVKEVNIDNTGTLSGVISQIFDKALTEPTFCEMYANFCFHLAGALPDFTEDNEKITFKRLLLNKCQEEFERGEREQDEANRDEDGEIKQTAEERELKKIKARRRMLGNIRLIGELYKKKMLTERIMHECIKKLLGQYQNPDEEDIEALCKLMSTIGEMIDHPKAKEHMDAYFDVMTKLSTNQKLSSRVRFMLRDAIDLRKNKWQERRKVEGPKKIEEVHRDAAQERQAQSSRLARGSSASSSARRGPPVDYGSRGTLLPSPSSQSIGAIRNIPHQGRGFGSQDVRFEERHSFESRTLSVPLPQRPIDDDSITLGPQGGLGRGMSIRGQPLLPMAPLADIPPSTGDSRRMASGLNGYNSSPDWKSHNSREELMPRHVADRFAGASHDPLNQNPQDHNSYFGNRDLRNSVRALDRSLSSTSPAGRGQGSSIVSQDASTETGSLSEERLCENSISTIREFYSAKDEKEVSLCVRELNSPSFYPSMVSLWVIDSFERKDIERDLLAELLVNLCKPQDSLLSQMQLIQGFESVLSSLEDAVNDAPKAAEFLGHIFAKVILENVISLTAIGRLIHEGGEEPGRLLEIGLASEILGSVLEVIRIEKGDTILNEIRSSSNLQLEDFQSPGPVKSRKLDAFL